MHERPPKISEPEHAPLMPKFRGDRRPAGGRFTGVLLRFLKGPRTDTTEERTLAEPLTAGDADSVEVPNAQPPSDLMRSSSPEPIGPDAHVVEQSSAPEEAVEPVAENTAAASPEAVVESEIIQEDYKLVRTLIRELQVAGKCPECFPLNPADLDRLAVAVHGVSSPEDARAKVLTILEEIATARK
jgi:hypothetical protein